MNRFPENMFLLSLRQDHVSNQTVKSLDPTPLFSFSKNCGIFTQIQQNNPLKQPRWLVSDTCMHGLPENIFVLSLRQGHLSN